MKSDNKTPLFLANLFCFGMKYEISASDLTPPPNFSLFPPKIEKLVKSWTLTPPQDDKIT